MPALTAWTTPKKRSPSCTTPPALTRAHHTMSQSDRLTSPLRARTVYRTSYPMMYDSDADTIRCRKVARGGEIVKTRRTPSKLLLFPITAVLVLAGCGDGGGADTAGDTAGDSEGPVQLRYSSILEPSHPWLECGAESMAEDLEGLFDVQIFASGQLGSNQEAVDSVIAGNLEMTTVGPGELAQLHAPLAVLDAAYALDDFDHLLRVMEGAIGDELTQGFKDATGAEILGVWFYGDRHVTANQPVRTPEDLSGVKIRVPDAPIYLANAQAMGGEPTPVSFAELYVALSQGVVDAQENPISTIASQRFVEVQDYISLTAHQVQSGMNVVNADFYNGLTNENREALDKATQDAAVAVRECIEVEDAEFLEEWQESGVLEIVDDVDREAFAAKAESELPSKFEWDGLYEDIRELSQ